MREEYVAIVEAGLILQLDDPAIAENYDQIIPEPSAAAYRRFNQVRIDALNHAIRGPARGPHPLPPVLGQLARPPHGRHPDGGDRRDDARRQREVLLVRGGQRAPRARVARLARREAAGGQGAPARHRQPRTNVIEHPQVVADRIVRFAEGVGRENVIASTDCGLGGRVHPQLAWAKLRSLSEGAALATKELWG